MITLRKKDGKIFLIYKPDQADPNWVNASLKDDGEVFLRSKTFTFKSEDLLKFDDESFKEEYVFLFAEIETGNEYYKVLGRRLGISYDVYFHKDIKLSLKYFLAPYNISIFKKIGRLIDSDLYIAGDNTNALSVEDFNGLVKNFPSTYELQKYTDARLSAVLGDYFSSASQVNEKYTQYMNKKVSAQDSQISKIFKELEVEKYKEIIQKLERMLQQPEVFNEKQWQLEILDIVLLLFPKYVYAFENAVVRDAYQNKNRKLDLILVDADGNVDVIEIKKPFDEAIVSSGKYRDNHVPKRELSGSIVQLEKYIFHLSKSGKKGEEKLTEQFKQSLPQSFEIRITNPLGLIIVGRSNNLTNEQKADFEVIKRKYKHLLDIVTYDDLLARLKRIIAAWESR